jgi:hypothetical protein
LDVTRTRGERTGAKDSRTERAIVKKSSVLGRRCPDQELKDEEWREVIDGTRSRKEG